MARKTTQAPAPKEAPPRLNLSLRTLAPAEIEALDGIRSRLKIKTRAGAVARALVDWHQLRSAADTIEANHEELDGLVRDYAHATERAHDAMEAESAALAALLAYAKRPSVMPRQMRIGA